MRRNDVAAMMVVLVMALGAGCSDDTGTPDSGLPDTWSADGPVTDGPVADGPAADGPVADGPVADGPVTDSATVDAAQADTKAGADAGPDLTPPDALAVDTGPGKDLAPPDLFISTDAKITCKTGSCSASSTGDCSCSWTCTDGNSYDVSCQNKGAYKDCQCKINGAASGTCITKPLSGACYAHQCCGFPTS
jgi:hypothetical protein